MQLFLLWLQHQRFLKMMMIANEEQQDLALLSNASRRMTTN